MSELEMFTLAFLLSRHPIMIASESCPQNTKCDRLSETTGWVCESD